MARDAVGFSRIQARDITFAHDGSIVYASTAANGSVSVGKAVKMVAAGQVGLATDGADVVGELLIVEDDGFCLVQNTGVANLPSAGTITFGTKIVGAVGGKIRSVVASALADVAAGRGRVLDASDVDNVKVLLD